ncbi:uncharacterized protein [Asterias amurensis]|uniref:uncharacterized protein n=1 Tax=Asterias amurensis TaxID=7602 RepID=UPI003AB82747
MALSNFIFVLLACFLKLSASQFVDIDISEIGSPSDIVDGGSTDVTFDLDITPTSGAASVINALGNDLRYKVQAGLSATDTTDLSAAVGVTTVTLSSGQKSASLVDDDATTWSSLVASVDLTNVDCGSDGTAYNYFCIVVGPADSSTWSGVDTSNTTSCASFVCKAVVDVGADSLSITNPDDGVISVGGGQALEFDIEVSSTAASDLVSGSSNWAVTIWLSDAATDGTVVASTSVSLTAAQLTTDLSNGTTATLSDLAATLDLTDITCDSFSYSCASVGPASSATWKVIASGATKDTTACQAVTCGAAFAHISLAFLSICVAFSSLFNQS